MAATGYTPILIYGSTTTGNTPLAANLTTSASGVELAINAFDGKLFYKDSGGTVQVLATKGTAAIGGSNTQVQYNSSGSLAGSANLTFDGTSLTLGGNPTLSAGTAGGVAYLNGSKVLTSGSALTFDGTLLTNAQSSASSGLLLNLQNATTGSYMQFAMPGVANVRFGSPNADAFVWQTFGSGSYPEQMRLTSTGLGIGTSSPLSKLHLNDSTGTAVNLIRMQTAWSSPSGNKSIVWADGSDVLGRISVSYTAASGSQMSFGSLYNGGYQTSDLMVLSSSGNLGLGVTSPAVRLDVNGSIKATSYIGFDLGTANTSGMYTVSTNVIGFTTGATERARITSDGDLLVGTTTAGGRLAVTAGSAIQSPIATSGVSGDKTYQAILVTKFDNDTTTSQNFIQFQVNNGGANCGKITANGANTAAFASTSDQRVKENIVDLPPQLDNILSLRPVEFDYIEELGGGHQVGFIAQEMQQVFPDAVSGDGTEQDILSITGWSKTEARLVKAIQEQQALITSLTARIAALEAQ